jgi:HAD superfamily hydrolase (TIGR01509 family)
MFTTLKALIFDVDGTLADTESLHCAAFNLAFTELGLGWHWNTTLYTDLLSVTGGKERIMHFWGMHDPDQMANSRVGDMVDELHRAKTRHYENLVKAGELPLRPGVQQLIAQAYTAQLPMAIATTTTPENIDVLLRINLGADWRKYFVAVCDASTVRNKKPAPDVYLAALDLLGLRGSDCLAFEDSENGLRAADLAGIPTLVTPTGFTCHQKFNKALRVLPQLSDVADLATLEGWHRNMVPALA